MGFGRKVWHDGFGFVFEVGVFSTNILPLLVVADSYSLLLCAYVPHAGDPQAVE